MTTLMDYIGAFRRGEYHTRIDIEKLYYRESHSPVMRLDVNHTGIRTQKIGEASGYDEGIDGLLNILS